MQVQLEKSALVSMFLLPWRVYLVHAHGSCIIGFKRGTLHGDWNGGESAPKAGSHRAETLDSWLQKGLLPFKWHWLQ